MSFALVAWIGLVAFDRLGQWFSNSGTRTPLGSATIFKEFVAGEPKKKEPLTLELVILFIF